MVVSKRCKVCTALYDDSISISGEYFGKSLSDLIEKISGVKLDPRKANGVLICTLCATQIVQVDMIIDKLRNTLQRLTKPVKQTKPKTPSKETGANTNSDEPMLNSKTAVVRRKSVSLDNSFVNNKEEPKENIGINGNLTTPLELKCNKDLEESKKQKESNVRSSKNIVRRKSECLNKNNEDNGKRQIVSSVTSPELKELQEATSEIAEVNSNEMNNEVELKTETPKKLIRRKTGSQQNSVEPKISSTIKGKRIVSGELTPEKPTLDKSAKRKQIFNEDNLSKYDICERTPPKRKKSISISAFEENSLNRDVQEFAYSDKEISLRETKILNCVICGKEFGKKSSLREHIDSNHMGEKLKECSYCSKEFRSQQKYESHIFSGKCKHPAKEKEFFSIGI